MKRYLPAIRQQSSNLLKSTETFLPSLFKKETWLNVFDRKLSSPEISPGATRLPSPERSPEEEDFYDDDDDYDGEIRPFPVPATKKPKEPGEKLHRRRKLSAEADRLPSPERERPQHPSAEKTRRPSPERARMSGNPGIYQKKRAQSNDLQQNVMEVYDKPKSSMRLNPSDDIDVRIAEAIAEAESILPPHRHKNFRDAVDWYNEDVSPRSVCLRERGFVCHATQHSRVSRERDVTKEVEVAKWIPTKLDNYTLAAALHVAQGPMPKELCIVQRAGKGMFKLLKKSNFPITEIVEMMLDEDAGYDVLVITRNREENAVVTVLVRNEGERAQMTVQIAKAYYEFLAQPLKISGATMADLIGENKSQHLRRVLERTFLTAKQVKEREKRRPPAMLQREVSDEERAYEQIKRKNRSKTSSGVSKPEYEEREFADPTKRILVGRHVVPKLGLHVRLTTEALESEPSLTWNSKSGNGVVTALLVATDKTISGCEVLWERTGRTSDIGMLCQHVPGACSLEEVPWKGYRVRDPNTMGAEEEIIGVDVYPFAGMRVRLRRGALEAQPSLLSDAKGSSGTIKWVNPKDEDGDGVPGDTVKVKWDVSDKLYIYNTGLNGDFQLKMSYEPVKEKVGDGDKKASTDKKDSNDAVESLPPNYRQAPPDMESDEKVVGAQVMPQVGMRVVLRKQVLLAHPEMIKDTNGGAGIITWVDPEDADGDGVPGDVCRVKWALSEKEAEYRTGFQGDFRLALAPSKGKSGGDLVGSSSSFKLAPG